MRSFIISVTRTRGDDGQGFETLGPAQDSFEVENVGVKPAGEKKGEARHLSVRVVDASLEEASQESDAHIVGDAGMPLMLVQPASTGGSSGPPPGQVSWGVEAVGATESPWTGSGVSVAVLDTGIDRKHDAFKGVDFVPDDLCDFTGSAPANDPVKETLIEGVFHGTHCAGTLFGREAHGMRIGVAPGVTRAIVGKVIGDKGGSVEGIVQAILWAYGRKAQVISLSVGQNYNLYYDRLNQKYDNPRRAMAEVIGGYVANLKAFDRLAELLSNNIPGLPSAVLVAAAGNESDRPSYAANLASPASGAKFASVGAVARNQQVPPAFSVCNFSNRGPAFLAPGKEIWSAMAEGTLVPLDGTSMATPHAAGVAALWIEKRRSLKQAIDAVSIIDAMKQSCLPLPPEIPSDDNGNFVQAPDIGHSPDA